MTNEEKREKAIQYLKARGIWVLDGFTPTRSHQTDIRKTFAKYREWEKRNAKV